MLPFEYDIPNQLQGDTFDGVEFTLTATETSNPVDLTGYAVKMQIRDTSRAGRVLKEFEIGTGIVVTDAVNGVITVQPFLADIAIGNHYYDVEFTKNGNVSTWISGEFNVVSDVTK